MKVKTRVAKFSGDRKIVEIPSAVKENFKIGEVVYIVKLKKKGKCK